MGVPPSRLGGAGEQVLQRHILADGLRLGSAASTDHGVLYITLQGAFRQPVREMLSRISVTTLMTCLPPSALPCLLEIVSATWSCHTWGIFYVNHHHLLVERRYPVWLASRKAWTCRTPANQAHIQIDRAWCGLVQVGVVCRARLDGLGQGLTAVPNGGDPTVKLVAGQRW